MCYYTSRDHKPGPVCCYTGGYSGAGAGTVVPVMGMYSGAGGVPDSVPGPWSQYPCSPTTCTTPLPGYPYHHRVHVHHRLACPVHGHSDTPAGTKMSKMAKLVPNGCCQNTCQRTNGTPNTAPLTVHGRHHHHWLYTAGTTTTRK